MSQTVAFDWANIFIPTLGILEVMMRGTIMYLGMFIIFRVIARRQTGSFSPADLLVIVLVADAAQNGLGKEYGSVTEGLALVLTIVFWEFAIDWMAWRFPVARAYLTRAPVTLINNGNLDETAMKREMLTEEELQAQLREQGLDDIRKVKLGNIEGSGHISVIRADNLGAEAGTGQPPARFTDIN